MRREKAMREYKEMDSIEIPESIPEAGIEAGDTGVIDSIYDEGRRLLVEVSRPDEHIGALIDLETQPRLRVLAHSKLSV